LTKRAVLLSLVLLGACQTIASVEVSDDRLIEIAAAGLSKTGTTDLEHGRVSRSGTEATVSFPEKCGEI